MKKRDLVAAALLAVWMILSYAIAGTIYLGARYIIETAKGDGHFYALERSLGGFTVHITTNATFSILWAQAIFFMAVLTLLALPAVVVLRRRSIHKA